MSKPLWKTLWRSSKTPYIRPETKSKFKIEIMKSGNKAFSNILSKWQLCFSKLIVIHWLMRWGPSMAKYWIVVRTLFHLRNTFLLACDILAWPLATISWNWSSVRKWDILSNFNLYVDKIFGTLNSGFSLSFRMCRVAVAAWKLDYIFLHKY